MIARGTKCAMSGYFTLEDVMDLFVNEEMMTQRRMTSLNNWNCTTSSDFVEIGRTEQQSPTIHLQIGFVNFLVSEINASPLSKE